MIRVNENLTGQSSLVLSGKDLANRFGAVYLNDLGLIDGKTYTISANLSLSEGEEATIIVFNSDYTVNHKSTRLSTKKRSSLTFVYSNESTSKIACYAGISGRTNGISAEYTNIKLEKGEQMTPYLPHKSKVKADNQPLLPPEGNYKEIQAL